MVVLDKMLLQFVVHVSAVDFFHCVAFGHITQSIVSTSGREETQWKKKKKKGSGRERRTTRTRTCLVQLFNTHARMAHAGSTHLQC